MSDGTNGDRTPPRSPTMVMIIQGRLLQRRLDDRLSAHGLSLRKLGLLGHLSRNPGMSYSELARRAGIKVQSLHPIMAELTSEGCVRTVGEGRQGRAAIIELTPHGREAMDLAYRVIADIDQETFQQEEWTEAGLALTALGDVLWRKMA